MSNFKGKKKSFQPCSHLPNFWRALQDSSLSFSPLSPPMSSFQVLHLSSVSFLVQALNHSAWNFQSSLFLPVILYHPPASPSATPLPHQIFHTHCCKSDRLSIWWYRCVFIMFLVTQCLQGKVSCDLAYFYLPQSLSGP